jgi:hypothetical protein
LKRWRYIDNIDAYNSIIGEFQKLYEKNLQQIVLLVLESKKRYTVYKLMSKYNIDKVYIDGANPSFIRSLKIQIGETADYIEELARYKHQGLTEEQALRNMKIIPVSFGKEHKAMLGHCKLILEDSYIAIHPSFDKLITSLRTAVDADGTLDKESTSYNDIFDAFRLALKFYSFREKDD